MPSQIATTAVFRAVALILLSLLPMASLAYSPYRNLPEGWRGEWDIGGQFTRGSSTQTRFSAAAKVSYARNSWQNLVRVRLLRNQSKVRTTRRDENGDLIVDQNGTPRTEFVKQMTSNRRFVGIEPRIFLNDYYFLFTVLDHEVDIPGGIKYASRQVFGSGIRIWRNKKNYITASVGYGTKRSRRTNSESSRKDIGYMGFKLVRGITHSIGFLAELDSDFGSSKRFTDLRLGLAWTLREPLTLKLKYESRFDDDITAIENISAENVRSVVTFNFGLKWK